MNRYGQNLEYAAVAEGGCIGTGTDNGIVPAVENVTLTLWAPSDYEPTERDIEDDLNDWGFCLCPGSSWRLVPKVTPDGANGKATWSSSDESVATVDQDGLVTGVNEGYAKITATMHNGKIAMRTVGVHGIIE